jgi:hypothetical protein
MMGLREAALLTKAHKNFFKLDRGGGNTRGPI